MPKLLFFDINVDTEKGFCRNMTILAHFAQDPFYFNGILCIREACGSRDNCSFHSKKGYIN